MVKVQATKLGYYGHQRRNPGEVFVIKDEKAFSKVWMRRVPDSVRETPPSSNFKSSRAEEIARAERAEEALKGTPTIDPPDALAPASKTSSEASVPTSVPEQPSTQTSGEEVI